MTQLRLDLITQRMTRGRSSYRPTRPYFDPTRYAVDEIPERESRPFVLTHHYSGTFPAAILSAGLYETSPSPFRHARLVGITVFGVPMNTSRKISCLLRDGESPCDLSRFVLTDDVLGNAETFFLRRALSILREHKTTPEGLSRHPIVTAYSDPMPRRNIMGEITFRGHYGCIYQAHNSLYLGRATPRTLWMTPDGTNIIERTLSKLSRDECGSGYAERQLLEKGATGRDSHESGRSWIARLKKEKFLRPVRHHGNHLYVFPATTEKKRRHTITLALNPLDDRPKFTDLPA